MLRRMILIGAAAMLVSLGPALSPAQGNPSLATQLHCARG